jgi:hypothetical protein
MIRFLFRLVLASIAAFVLLAVLQDEPPVARFIAQAPPALGRALREARAAVTGKPVGPAPGLTRVANSFQQAVGEAAKKTGEAARQVEGEVRREIDSHERPAEADGVPPKSEPTPPPPSQ